MSKENAKLFYEELAKNEALHEKFKVIGKKYEGQKFDEVQMDLIYQKEIMPIAKGAGFEFTLAELKEYKQDVKQPQSGKLSDEELDAVAGGACIIYSKVANPIPVYPVHAYIPDYDKIQTSKFDGHIIELSQADCDMFP